MIRSMTGYGRSEIVTEEYKIVMEIKSVNHRYCDVSIRLPKKFNAMEIKLREMMKEYASRGKIDVFFTYEDYSGSDVRLNYHEKLAEEYMEIIGRLSEKFSIKKELSAASILRFPEVLSIEEVSVDTDSLAAAVEQSLREAGTAFVRSREAEGGQLYRDILAKLTYIETLVAKVEERSPDVYREYREKLEGKAVELLGDRQMDEAVLATELVIYADKVCVDEETVRLRSHVKAMEDTLQREEAIGRKLDFIAQEMNREANTILSKANDRELSACAIDLKTEIEKIREQIQNIE